MEITCIQMDVLISFYIEGDLSKALKEKVEEHLKNCPACRAKFEIISSLLKDLRESIENEQEEVVQTGANSQYRLFQNNLSAYVDNELPAEENIKIKKFTINNKRARKELENTYNIRKLMNDSFKKTKSESRHDFSRNVMKQLDMTNESWFSPIVKSCDCFCNDSFSFISNNCFFSNSIG